MPTSDFIGTWRASALEYTSTSNPSQKAEVIASGWSYELTLAADGAYHEVVTPFGGAAEHSSGTWEASIDVFTLNETSPYPGNAQFDYTLTNETLTLSGADAEYDFDNDGTPDAAKLAMVLFKAE